MSGSRPYLVQACFQPAELVPGVCVFPGKAVCFYRRISGPFDEREAGGTEGSGPSCRRPRRWRGGRDRDVRSGRRDLRDRPHHRECGQAPRAAEPVRRKGAVGPVAVPRRGRAQGPCRGVRLAARTPRRSARGPRRTATRSTTAAVSRRPSARRTRRPTADPGCADRSVIRWQSVASAATTPYRPTGTPVPIGPLPRHRSAGTAAPPRSPGRGGRSHTGATGRRRPPGGRHSGCAGARIRPPAPSAVRSSADPAPLQPLQQPRQLLGAAGRHQQPDPGPSSATGPTGPVRETAQHREARLGGTSSASKRTPVTSPGGSARWSASPARRSYQPMSCATPRREQAVTYRALGASTR